MFAKLMSLLPRDLLVHLYKRFPFRRLKKWIVYRAQAKFLVGVMGIFTNDQGEILLLRHDYRRKPWGVPGGWLEYEQPEAGLLRELMEETGLEARLIGEPKVSYGSRPHRIDLVYRGEITGGTFRPSSEISDMRFCAVGEWPEPMSEAQKTMILEVMEGVHSHRFG